MKLTNSDDRRALARRPRVAATVLSAAVLTFVGIVASNPSWASPPSVPSAPGTIDGHPLAEVLPPDAIRALDAPCLVSASEARSMADDERVIGVVVSGQARAYALDRLDWHEVVNDHVHGRPFAVTW